MTANVVQMAYVGQTPWHGEGSKLTDGADIDTWKREAGLGYEVKKAAVRYICDGDEKFGMQGVRTFGDRFVTYRGDDGTPLGVVSDRYKIVQPGEIVEFYRDFVSAGGMKLETAGTLLNSRRVWGLASLDVPFELPGGDVTRPYFLLATSYDGETATTGTFTSVRVVCCNTLRMALSQHKAGGKTTGFSISHSREFDRSWAQQQAQNLLDASREYQSKAELLAATGINRDQLLRYFIGLVGAENDKGEMTTRSKNKVDRLVQLYKSGPGADLPSAKGTVWGALNAVTRYIDFETPTRGDSSRFARGQFGPNANLKDRALAEALELAVAA